MMWLSKNFLQIVMSVSWTDSFCTISECPLSTTTLLVGRMVYAAVPLTVTRGWEQWLAGWTWSGDVPDDYVSTYQTPEPHTTCRYGTRVRWTGMIHSDWICDLLCRAR